MTTQGQGHSLTFVQGHSDSIFSNYISTKNTRPIEAKFRMEPPLMTFKLGIQHRVLKYYQICSNDDLGLTLTIFMTWSNLFLSASA